MHAAAPLFHNVCGKAFEQEERKQLLSSLIVLAAGTLQEKEPLVDEKAFMLEIAVMLNQRRISEGIESLPAIVTDYESSVYLDTVLSEERKLNKAQVFSGQADHPNSAMAMFVDAVLMKALGGSSEVMKDEKIKKCYRECGVMIHEGYSCDIAKTALDFGLAQKSLSQEG